MSSPFHIRAASVGDAAELLEIYRPFVEESTVSFEIEAPSLEEFERRIDTALRGWAWLVAEVDGTPVGYAYGSTHRAREAYRYSVETSAYVHEDHRRRGVARALYSRLCTDLGDRGFAGAYAGVAMPNEASICFHRDMGFQPIGVFPRVGRKFGAWHDVAWLYRPLGGEAAYQTDAPDPAV